MSTRLRLIAAGMGPDIVRRRSSEPGTKPVQRLSRMPPLELKKCWGYKSSQCFASWFLNVTRARIDFVRVPRQFSPYFCLMKSMTGYGRSDCSQDGFKITVELSSVNRKQSEISVNLPREMEMLEAPIRDVINRYIARGRLTVRVGLHAGASKQSARMHLNVPLAKAYARELSRLSKQLHLPGPVTLDHLARAPGVFQTDEQIAEEEDFWPDGE